jgi:hypothetical protein
VGQEDGCFAVMDANLEEITSDIHPLLQHIYCREQIRIDWEKPPLDASGCIEIIPDIHGRISNPLVAVRQGGQTFIELAHFDRLSRTKKPLLTSRPTLRIISIIASSENRSP